MRRFAVVVGVLGVAVGAASCGLDGVSVADGCDPGVVSVVSFDAGAGGGFNVDRLPGVVAGDPTASEDEKGGTLDVVSLGDGGSIVVEVGCAIRDHAGIDFVVHENAFVVSGGSVINTEAGVVGVSDDGVSFVDFDCVADDFKDDGVDGCAGMAPGGDEFDLASVSADDVSFVRIVDRAGPGGPGADGKAGFDLDAVVVVSHD